MQMGKGLKRVGDGESITLIFYNKELSLENGLSFNLDGK